MRVEIALPSEQASTLLTLEGPLLRVNHAHMAVAVGTVQVQRRLSVLGACGACGTYLRRKRLGHCGQAYGRSPPPLAMVGAGANVGVGVGVAGLGVEAGIAGAGADQRMPPACALRRWVFSSSFVWNRLPHAAHQNFFSSCCLPSPAGDGAPLAAAAAWGAGGARGRRSTGGGSAGAIDGGMGVVWGGQQRAGAAARIEVERSVAGCSRNLEAGRPTARLSAVSQVNTWMYRRRRARSACVAVAVAGGRRRKAAALAAFFRRLHTASRTTNRLVAHSWRHRPWEAARRREHRINLHSVASAAARLRHPRSCNSAPHVDYGCSAKSGSQ